MLSSAFFVALILSLDVIPLPRYVQSFSRFVADRAFGSWAQMVSQPVTTRQLAVAREEIHTLSQVRSL